MVVRRNIFSKLRAHVLFIFMVLVSSIRAPICHPVYSTTSHLCLVSNGIGAPDLQLFPLFTCFTRVSSPMKYSCSYIDVSCFCNFFLFLFLQRFIDVLTVSHCNSCPVLREAMCFCRLWLCCVLLNVLFWEGKLWAIYTRSVAFLPSFDVLYRYLKSLCSPRWVEQTFTLSSRCWIDRRNFYNDGVTWSTVFQEGSGRKKIVETSNLFFPCLKRRVLWV